MGQLEKGLIHEWNRRQLPLDMAPQETTTGEYYTKVCTKMIAPSLLVP